MRLFILTLSLISVKVFAGTQIGYIDTLYARADGLHLVTLTDASTIRSKPSCATHKYWLIKDENATYGKSQFSQLLSAKLAKRKVTIRGTDTCSRWRDGEDISYITIHD